MSGIDQMNHRFADVGGVRFCASPEVYPQLKGSLPLLVVENKLGRLVLALQGAHILSFVPAGGSDLLWLSPQTRLAEGEAIRGGIPLCLPWFGPHAAGYPQHGFARTTPWQVDNITAEGNGTTKVALTLAQTEKTLAMWPHAFVFRLEIVVGRQLELNLSAKNLSTAAARFELAFHTYFNVGDVYETALEGLDGCFYEDREDGKKRKQQHGPMRVAGTTTRLYLDVSKFPTINSPAGNYRIEGTPHCCMVWNAGDKDKTMADMGAGNHRGYLCVEPVDTADWTVSIAPGESYGARMVLSVK